ncbi:TPA: hypothetical protein NHK69_003915 [Pseudomonas aeruginosa]|nr:hypothetical protein [Pseudomonas aeruginosa]
MSRIPASRAFRYLATLSAGLFFVLAATWLFAPATLLAGWGVPFDSESTGIVGRRAAPLYAAIGLMLYWVRKAPRSEGRTAVVIGFIVACLLLAILGCVEWAAGRVNAGILPAVLLEVGLSLAFIFVTLKEQKQTQWL